MAAKPPVPSTRVPVQYRSSGYSLYVCTRQWALVDFLGGEERRRRGVVFAEAAANYDRMWQELPAAEKAVWHARAKQRGGSTDDEQVQIELAAKSTAELSALQSECSAAVQRSTADYGETLAARNAAGNASAEERRRLDASVEAAQCRMSADQRRHVDIERAVRLRCSETKRKQRAAGTGGRAPQTGGLKLITAAQRHAGDKSPVVPPPPSAGSDTGGPHASLSTAAPSPIAAGPSEQQPSASGAVSGSPPGRLYDTVMRCLDDDERPGGGKEHAARLRVRLRRGRVRPPAAHLPPH